MIKIYLKQAWETARQNRLFSSIYVIGTGLSIALTMTLFIIFYVKTAPVYPEYNRDRTLVVRYVKTFPSQRPENWNAGMVGPRLVELADSLPHVADVAATMITSPDGNFVALPGQKQAFDVRLLYVNSAFWRVFTPRFLSGKPLTGADEEGLMKAAGYLKEFLHKIDPRGRIQVIGPASPYVGKVSDVYRRVLYLKEEEEAILIEAKNRMEQYIEANRGFEPFRIQFDLDPMGVF